jgi:hypothetical protein
MGFIKSVSWTSVGKAVALMLTGAAGMHGAHVYRDSKKKKERAEARKPKKTNRKKTRKAA